VSAGPEPSWRRHPHPNPPRKGEGTIARIRTARIPSLGPKGPTFEGEADHSLLFTRDQITITGVPTLTRL
jgi:hypothetical protein